MTDTPLSSDDLEARLETWAISERQYPFFDGTPADLPRWLHWIEAGLLDHNIPIQQWSDAAIYFLAGDLKIVMQERMSNFLQMNQRNQWEWEDFKHDIRQVVEAGEQISQSSPPHTISERVADLRRNHPFIVASASLGLIVGGSTVVVPALGLAALSAVGFTAGGVVGGSLASILQSAIYGAYTTGVFSILQSIAATSVAASSASIAAASTAVSAGFITLFYGSSDDTASSPPPMESPPTPSHQTVQDSRSAGL